MIAILDTTTNQTVYEVEEEFIQDAFDEYELYISEDRNRYKIIIK